MGKAMISSYLVDEIHHLATRSSQMTIAYYFCDDKDEKRRTGTAILRGLLLQVLRQRPILLQLIQLEYDEAGDNLFNNFHTLWRVFTRVLDDERAGNIHWLIDAVDECEEVSRGLLLKEITRLFHPARSESRATKLIITSRRQHNIEKELIRRCSITKELQIDSGKVNHDLNAFINVKVDELALSQGYNATLKNDVKRALNDKAEGTFLYISLVVHDLDRTLLQRRVREKLSRLPADLNRLYDSFLLKISPDDTYISKSVLQWVVTARRPLTVRELAIARLLDLGKWTKDTEPSEDELLEFENDYRCCEPLIRIDPRHNTINLTHQSAKDYLIGESLKTNNDLSQFHVDMNLSNFSFFHICWAYLSSQKFRHG